MQIQKQADLGNSIVGTLWTDGTMTIQGDLQGTDRVDLPKASVDRLADIFKEIKEENKI
jgi:hypothetical protein|tara:strand:- start:1692 stop:1868 length:177 start_codon:yes stop_codon:yes gene_type:complete